MYIDHLGGLSDGWIDLVLVALGLSRPMYIDHLGGLSDG